MNILDPQAIADIVSQHLTDADVPDSHKNAIVGDVDKNGAQVVALFKMGKNDKWEVQAVAQHDWSGDNNVGGKVIYSW